MAKRKRTQRRKPNKHLKNIALALLFTLIGLVLLWPYLRSALLKVLAPVGRGIPGILEHRVSGETVFSRGQTVLIAPASGTIIFKVKDGDSVRVGDVIAEIGDKDALAGIDENLSHAQAELLAYENETAAEFKEITHNLQISYEETLSSFYHLQRDFALSRSLGCASQEADLNHKLKVLLKDRDELMKLEDRRSFLVSQVELMQNIASSSSVRVLAPISGIFHSYVSTSDITLSEKDLSGKDASELSVLARELEDVREYYVEDRQEIEYGHMIGRIVSGENMRFYLVVKTEDRPVLNSGSKMMLETLGGTSMQVKISDVTDGKPPGYSVISGEIDCVPPGGHVRASKTSLVVKREEGIIVPTKSLINKNGETGVLIVQKTYAIFHPVEVKMIRDNQAVIQGMNETSHIVLNGLKFFEGRRVR